VETAEQVAILRDNNCDEIQGYYFSKPVSFEAIADLLRKQVQSPTASGSDQAKS